MSGRVLVVDDSEVARALLARTLRREGFEVLEARDGAEGALLALQQSPDAVVTDLEMPVMDGYQLLHLLRHDPAGAAIPVLILTSHDEAASRFWGLHTGADAYLTKDQASERLVATVSGLIAQAASAPRSALVDPPQGPLDVLARVARHLDASLLRATLTNALLESGMAAESLHDACLAALEHIRVVVDASFLAIAVAEPEAATVHVFLPRSLSLRAVDQCTSTVLEGLEIQPGANIDVLISGERNGGEEVSAAGMVLLRLPLRNASGVLALLPREAARFEHSARPLVEPMLAHLAVLLDNARLSQRLRELSTLDGLTRLLNHRAIHERLVEEVNRAQRYGHPLAAVLCDLDHFKAVNDEHGHLAGDAALRAAATSMRACLRSADAFGRYGGEEFLVVLPESGLEAGRRAAERLRRALAGRAIALPDGAVVRLTGSFGVATLTELPAPAGADALVSLADTRLYAAKAAGRDCVRP